MLAKLFKSEKAFNRSLYMHPITLMIMWDMYHYCLSRDLEFVVTETVTTLQEDKDLGRMSSSHRTGRAFDLRNRSWDLLQIKSFESHFNKKYEKYAAMDRHGHKRLVVSIPHGSGPHFHVQIHSRYILDLNLDNRAYFAVSD